MLNNIRLVLSAISTSEIRNSPTGPSKNNPLLRGYLVTHNNIIRPYTWASAVDLGNKHKGPSLNYAYTYAPT